MQTPGKTTTYGFSLGMTERWGGRKENNGRIRSSPPRVGNRQYAADNNYTNRKGEQKMIKKAISAIMAIPVAIGFCTAGYKGKEPSCDHITERCSYVYTTKVETKENLGTFRLTYYTPYEEGGKWGYQTATGERSQHLKTCAVDPRVIPLGSTIEIMGKNGKKLTLLACDVGGLVKGRSIDIFIDNPSHKECNAFMEDFGEFHSVYLVRN